MSSMKSTILVIGGTGMLGEPVARQLQRDGFTVRILTRSPESAKEKFDASFEIVTGDVSEVESIRLALDGCAGVHINLNGGPSGDYDVVEHRGTANVAQTAAQAGVERLTYLSGISARDENRSYPPTAAKLDAAAAIRETGVSYTIFRATWFYESLHFFVLGDRAGILGKQANPLHWLAAADYARMVSKAYTVPESANGEFDILGPEPITMLDALTRYCAVRHPDLKPDSIPFWQAEIAAKMPGNEGLLGALPLMKFFDRFVENGDPAEANRLLGTPTTTLQDWLSQ